MAYVNAGAYVNGIRPASKKALKEAIRDAPGTVHFDCTDAYGTHAGYNIPAEAEKIGKQDTIQVTGPDPYTARKWYAAVSVNAKGTITVL